MTTSTISTTKKVKTSGDDLFDGGPGNDHAWGMFNGDDTCISVETIDDDCEHIS